MLERFFGVMSSDEVEARGVFRDSNGMRLNIEDGPKGWTIIWADYSTTFKDVNETTERNFEEAYDSATKSVGPLKIMEILSDRIAVNISEKALLRFRKVKNETPCFHT